MSEENLREAPPAEYAETARTFRSAWFFAGLLFVGFLIDLGLGGAIAHLPGWLLAFVLVVGIDLFVIWAANSTHSLSLTADELRVGDEAIGRAEIIAMTRGVDDKLPVLGWRTGPPRGTKGLIVRLFDDQDLVIPTRHPDRLEAALGVALDSGEQVREATPADLVLLPEIDERADTVFRMAGYDLPQVPFREDELADAKVVFVLGRPPVGFARVDEVDGLAHLAEMAVIPGSMRQGIGAALLERSCEWARAQGYRAITLTTYADVAWNGPYYAARGFVETDDVTSGLARLRERERVDGLDDVGRRVVMRRDLSG